MNLPDNLMLDQIREIIFEARKTAFREVNKLKVITNFQIGRIIVEQEQSGKKRAIYGKETLKNLSLTLIHEFGRGFSVDNLELMRQFYLIYQKKIEFPYHNPTATIDQKTLVRKSETLPRKSKLNKKSETLSRISVESANLLNLSWSHFILLMKMDQIERSFYEIESITNNWSTRELERQFNSSLFERLALSKDKNKIADLSRKGQILDQPSDLIKQPYVLEFLGLKEETSYSESDLEQAIISKIEHFLLELGKGFLFEARQKRLSFEGENFFVDLVFYNRILKCYVVIDLKIGKLSHENIGQMQMYVNYFDRMVKLPEENPTIGIVLCKQSNKAVVEFTLPEKDKLIFTPEYKLFLPSKAELKKQIENL
jgi:predicted nuclease of restriction endonuclease-like (RecB) superfamily